MTHLLDVLDKTYGEGDKKIEMTERRLILFCIPLSFMIRPSLLWSLRRTRRKTSFKVADVSGSLKRINSQYSGDNQREVSPSHYSGADPPATLGKF